MESKFINVKRIALSCVIISFCLIGFSQSVANPKIETPNVASLDKFGDVPVDFSTGVPNINIPIHTLHYGNISVPIALRYHPGSVRVTQHPGWVGFGWDLESIGSITRRVNGKPDEFYGSNIMGGMISTYYPEPVQNPPTSGSELADVPDWNTQSKLASFFGSGSIYPYYDILADEFSFNFMGYSGKFYFASPSKGWQVVCDQNVKVQLTNNTSPSLTGTQVLSTVTNQYSRPSSTGHLYTGGGNAPPETATNVFSGFILTVPDGTKYYFGGVDANGNGTGIEFYTPYGTASVQFNVNTWLLTKIVDVDGNEVDFNYSASYPTADLGFGYSVLAP